MTREEAIDTLKNGLWWDRKRLDEAIDTAISALHPVNREQVEDDFDGPDNPPAMRFCQWCGAPMTDKAVDMVIKRMEAIFSARNDD